MPKTLQIRGFRLALWIGSYTCCNIVDADSITLFLGRLPTKLDERNVEPIGVRARCISYRCLCDAIRIGEAVGRGQVAAAG